MANCVYCGGYYERGVWHYDPYCSSDCFNAKTKELMVQQERQWAEEAKRDHESFLANKEAFYSRECSKCAETVKAKALVCKECGYEFPDGEAKRAEIKNWEERAAKFKLNPWDTEKIKHEEWKLTPEGQAEEERKAKEKEEERRRKAEERRRKEEEERKAKEIKEKEEERLKNMPLFKRRWEERKRDFERAGPLEKKFIIFCLCGIVFCFLLIFLDWQTGCLDPLRRH